MASRVRLESLNEFDLIDTSAAVFDKAKMSPDSLIVVLFNIQFPERGTIEGKLKQWRNDYKNNGVQFYKCIISRGKQDIKTEFKIKKTPTFVFIRGDKEVDRIEDLEESDVNVKNPTKPGEDSNDEKRLKSKLNELCTPSSTVDPK
ncbi:unnamed protein product [Rotaria magnacalcarata]|uniref:Thioredoxin domain-containing protein n=1 Tax=Rotaria magnacalcarata TaxID=392030 RepID=A0A819R5C7_9BILA|nr:unnamed protein product [Rotaria magnacalcarata]CAF1620499.1 unnamed protein product [Rotaria magnacalcarata]CAF2077520.1 unnamed protein product [Rotaria magnacalcarata]CAF2123401.1 unnamed protein product [Rotaria magnacalcarata]CAF2202496.1 unnamed protein product [Rotaria magnacalcarata]